MMDIVAMTDLPETFRRDVRLHAVCAAGAERIEIIEDMMRRVDLQRISIRPRRIPAMLLEILFPSLTVDGLIASAVIEAMKE